MRKTRKIIMAIMIIMVMSMSIIPGVRAAEGDRYEVVMRADKEKAKSGETINISVNIENIEIESGEKGLGAYQAKLEYDKDVFELEKVKSGEDWDTPLENEGYMTATRADGTVSSEDQEIAIIKLKVKEEVEAGKTQIKLTNFEASNAEENIGTNDSKIEIEIIGEETENKNEEQEAPKDNNAQEEKPNEANNEKKAEEPSETPSENNPEASNGIENEEVNQGEETGKTNLIKLTLEEGEKATNNSENNETGSSTTVNAQKGETITAKAASDATVSAQNLPKTGKGIVSIIIGSGIIVLVAIGLICYKKYKKMNF